MGPPTEEDKFSSLVNAIKVFSVYSGPWIEVGYSVSADVAFGCISNLK